MNNKTNLFVCVLAVLSINLQYDITAYAAEENDITTEDLTSTETVDEAATAEIINGEEISTDAFDPTAPEFVSN